MLAILFFPFYPLIFNRSTFTYFNLFPPYSTSSISIYYSNALLFFHPYWLWFTKDPAQTTEPVLTPEPTVLEQSPDYTVSPNEEDVYEVWEEEPTQEVPTSPQVTTGSSVRQWWIAQHQIV